MSEKATATAAPEKTSRRSHGAKQGGRSSQLVSENPFAGLQQTIGNQAMLRLLEAGSIQTKLRVSQPGDADEREADRVAEQIVSSRKAPAIQRKCACAGEAPCSKCAGEEQETIHRSALSRLESVEPSIQRASAEGSTAAAGAEKSAPAKHATHPLVVEDDAKKVEPHQMRKSQFIALLRTDACATADAVLMSVGKSTKGCPYIEKWLSFYEKQSSQHIEAAMQKYAPETARARSAHEAIRLLVVRIQKAALSWAKTGKVEGLPPEMASQITAGAGFLEKLHNFATTGVAGAIFGFIGGKGKKEDEASSSGVMRKARTGEAAPAHDAASVRSQLGTGHSLDSRVQSQMSSAFGHDFAGVRVHTDAGAGKLSSDLQARAFTIGNDVAFASGEYRPGTLIGDALIAHELAHVVQQGGSERTHTPLLKSNGDYDAFEKDADSSALRSLVAVWLNAKSAFGEFRGNAAPRLRSGLKLHRCKSQSVEDAGKGTEAGKIEDAGKTPTIDASPAEAAPGGNMSNKKLSDADKSKIIDTFKPSSTSGQVGASMKDARFVLHDTGKRPTGKGKTSVEKAADLEKTEQARIAEHRKVGGTPAGEGPSSYVTSAGTPEVAHPRFLEADRPTATEFERGNDLMDKKSRETGLQKVWALTDSKEQATALSTYLSRFSTLSTKEVASETSIGMKRLDSGQTTPTNDPKPVPGWTTAQGAVGVICTKIAAGSGSGIAVKGKEKELETACGGLSALFTTRRERISSSTNVEISREEGSDCSTDPKKAKPFDPYPAADYTAVAKLYLLAALEIGQFPEITTHFFLDKPPITKTMNRCDPRCWDLGRLYATIASILGHPSGTTYGVDFIPGTAWGTSTIWWFDPVCGAKPAAKTSAAAGGPGTPPPVKKPE